MKNVVKFPKRQPFGKLGDRQLLWLRGNILEFREMQDRSLKSRGIDEQDLRALSSVWKTPSWAEPPADHGGIDPERELAEDQPTDGEKA